MGTEDNEVQFNNITLKSFKKKECGEGICCVSDTFTLKNGIPLNGLEVKVYDIENINEVYAKCVTNNDGEWKVFVDPGFY